MPDSLLAPPGSHEETQHVIGWLVVQFGMVKLSFGFQIVLAALYNFVNHGQFHHPNCTTNQPITYTNSIPATLIGLYLANLAREGETRAGGECCPSVQSAEAM